MTIVCPSCGSKDVRKTASYGTTVFTLFIIAGLTFFIGLLFWPMMILSGLLFLIALVMGTAGLVTKVASLMNKKGAQQWQEANWQWRCGECRKIFSQVPDETV